jgi:phosphate uptake regulator
MGSKTGVRVSLQAQPDGKLLIEPILEGRAIKTKRILAEQEQVIRKVCYKLIGPEIIEESSDCVVIQDHLTRMNFL